MNFWQSNKYIPIFGYRFFYKQFFLWNVAKPLGLPCWRKWKAKDNKLRRKYGRCVRNAGYKKECMLKFQKSCGVCGKPFKENDNINIDHIIPRSVIKVRKIYNKKNNLQLAHYECNQKKADKLDKIPFPQV